MGAAQLPIHPAVWQVGLGLHRSSLPVVLVGAGGTPGTLVGSSLP